MNPECISTFEGQKYEFMETRRPVEMYVREPSAGCNDNTGLMLVLHYWGGTYDMLFDACDEFADRYNVVAITVNYLQSGKDDQDGIPYDHGVIQAIDCLRALYHVQNRLMAEGKSFNTKRIYSCGQSGGGNVTLMCSKLAPFTFACILDLCGMPGLLDKIAFGIDKILDAGWSRDPKSPYYLTSAQQQIRDPGWLPHLQQQFKANPGQKIIIVHSLDDKSCPIGEKIDIFRNMVSVGFRPYATFVTPAHIDGTAITTIEHPVGNPPEIYKKFGDDCFLPHGKNAAVKEGPTDFELRHKVIYPVTGGIWTIDFTDLPTISFA